MPLPNVVTHQDRLLSVNINESREFPGSEPGSTIIPLFLDRENGVWVLYGKFDPGTTLPPHFHTGTVHFLTTKGQWNYVEYPEDPQTAGSYLNLAVRCIPSPCRRMRKSQPKASWLSTAPM
jgi:hypothetical protein